MKVGFGKSGKSLGVVFVFLLGIFAGILYPRQPSGVQLSGDHLTATYLIRHDNPAVAQKARELTKTYFSILDLALTPKNDAFSTGLLSAIEYLFNVVIRELQKPAGPTKNPRPGTRAENEKDKVSRTHDAWGHLLLKRA